MLIIIIIQGKGNIHIIYLYVRFLTKINHMPTTVKPALEIKIIARKIQRTRVNSSRLLSSRFFIMTFALTRTLVTKTDKKDRHK